MSIPSAIPAIIPARGGSKGLPRKNVLPLHGKPLIAWAIEAARAAKQVSQVYVSTDDPEISIVARQHGAIVIDRPVDLASDTATSEAALLHTLRILEPESGWHPEDAFVFLQCTSPLMTPEDIDGTIEKVRNDGADSAFSACRFHHFIWRRSGQGGHGINHDPAIRQRRQDRDTEYLENGAVYVMNTLGFLRHAHRFFGRTEIHEMPVTRSLEIDTLEDLRLAARCMTPSRHAWHPPRLEDLTAVILDFDGVLTDNRVSVDQNGVESVTCSRADGMGVRLLQEAGLQVLILSSEVNPVVRARADKLNVEIIHGHLDKAPLLKDWASTRGVDLRRAVYLGNDVNDLDCMRMVGHPVAVADAHIQAKSAAHHVLTQRGGYGAARELADKLLNPDHIPLEPTPEDLP